MSSIYEVEACKCVVSCKLRIQIIQVNCMKNVIIIHPHHLQNADIYRPIYYLYLSIKSQVNNKSEEGLGLKTNDLVTSTLPPISQNLHSTSNV